MMTLESHVVQLSQEIPSMSIKELKSLKIELQTNNTELKHYNDLIDKINKKLGCEHDGYLGKEVRRT